MYQMIKEYEKLYLVLQYCDYSLLDLINYRINQSISFKEDEIRFIIKEICNGLSDIHSNNYIHRDICPKNLYFISSHLLIGDFSNVICLRDKVECNYHGNIQYSSPELIENVDYATFNSDVYSLGLVLLELYI